MRKRFIKKLLTLFILVCIGCLPITFSACVRGKVSFGEDKIYHTHYFGNSVIVKEPTCSENGESENYCTCGISETQILPALGHNYVIHRGKEANCTEVGWEEYRTCSRCDYTDYVEIPALGHDFGEWEITKQASCTDNGEETRVCSRNETHIQSREQPANGHTEGEWVNLKSPTCEEAGFRIKVCSDCGETVATEELPATEHSFGDWFVKTAATCVSHGLEIRFCANDKTHFETRITNFSDHDYNWINCGETHGAVCAVCGLKIENLPHEWQNGVCSVCGCEKEDEEENDNKDEIVNLNFELFNGTSYVVTGIGADALNEIVIPSSYKKLPVTAVAPYAFRDCSFLTSVTVSSGVTEIGEGAFYGCKNLINIDMANTVEKIGDQAFYLCNKLKSLTIPHSVKFLGTSVFANCDNLYEVRFENCEGWQLSANDKIIGEVAESSLEDPFDAIVTLKTYQSYIWICA